MRHPEHAGLIARVLAIPPKRANKPLVRFLTDPEVDALLAAPDRSRWIGRRDHALLVLAIQTGLRVSELIGLRRQDISLGRGPHLRCEGKGRKDASPRSPARPWPILRAWLAEQRGEPGDPLFPASHHSGPLSRDAVERLLNKYAAIARPDCPSLKEQAPVAAHAASHQCDAAPTRRSRQDRDRLMAGARDDPDDRHISPR